MFFFTSFVAMSSHVERSTPLENIERGYTNNQISFFKSILEKSQDHRKTDKTQASYGNIKLFKKLRDLILNNNFSRKAIDNLCRDLGYKENSSECLTKDLLSVRTKKFGLTIPHLIVIFQNEKAFKWLLGVVEKYSLQSVLDNQDKRGWTPSHFAALHKTDSYLKSLKEAGANQEIKNHFQGTADQFFKITHIGDLKEQSVNIWDEEKGMVVSKNGEDFFKETGVHFVERLKVLSHYMILFWQFKNPSKHLQGLSGAQKSGTGPMVEDLDGVYDDLYVKKINLKEMGYEKEQDIGYGLFSLKDIPEGKIITDYQGIWVLNGENRVGKEHSTDNIDGTEVRGYAAFANECAPNAYMTRVANAHGNPGLLVLVSLKAINKDEMICWNYISHPIKKGNYVELEKGKVDDFVEKYGSLSKALSLEDEYVQQTLLYILGTNSVLIRLALEGRVKKEDLGSLRNNIKAKTLSAHINRVNQIGSFFSIFGGGLIRFLEILEEIPKESKSILMDFLLKEKSTDLTTVKTFFILTLAATPNISEKIIQNPISFDFGEFHWLRVWKDICKPYLKVEESSDSGILSNSLKYLYESFLYYFFNEEIDSKNKEVFDPQEAERRAASKTLQCEEFIEPKSEEFMKPKTGL
jgi:hypothetical protein